MSSQLTKDQLIQALPNKKLKNSVTDDLVQLVNAEPNDELRRVYKENVVGFASVLQEGGASIATYVDSVKFVSLKMLGDSNTIAYSKVFPDRYQRLVDNGTSGKDIASMAASYAKKKLVVKITEQTLVPVHILNMDLHQEAINVQAELMRNARSETVRQKAAESLIINLKAPEVAKVELDINYNNSDIVDDLRATTRALAQQQMKMIKAGHMSAQEAAHSDIIAKKVDIEEAEYSEVTRD